jgi:hypothetical protein
VSERTDLRAGLAGVGQDFLRGRVDLLVVQHLQRARLLQQLIYCVCGGLVGRE